MYVCFDDWRAILKGQVTFLSVVEIFSTYFFYT